MAMTLGRRMLTCHHEAGHALARWYFGYETDRVVVLSVAEIRAGVLIEDRRGRFDQCEGSCQGYDIHSPTLTREDAERYAQKDMQDGPRFLREQDTTAEIELIYGYAGAMAEAVYLKRRFFDCLQQGGEADEERVLDLAHRWFSTRTKQNNALVRAQHRVSVLVRSLKGREAIRLMAAALYAFGEIDGDEIDLICSGVYGARCEFAAWFCRRMPTIEQLRNGYIPPARRRLTLMAA